MTKDETPATDVAKDEIPATEVTEADESAAGEAVVIRFMRRFKRRMSRSAVLTAVGTAISILAFLGIDDIFVIISPPGECSLSMDLLGRSTYTRDDTLDGNCLTQHYSDGEYAKYYGFTLEQAATVTIEMTSQDVNSWLALRSGELPFGSPEVLGEDDDGGGGVDARIERFLPAGTYTIEATTRSAGLTGDFTLTVTVDPTDVTDACSVSIDPLGRGSTINGTLDNSCLTRHYPNGEYAKYYGFTLEPAATVTIEMTSRDVDSWLAFRSGSPPGSAEVLGENDDWGDGVDARIERFLDVGTYTIEATTASAGETGDFTLTVTVDPTDPTDACSVSIDPLERGSTINGTLDGSCLTRHYPDGEYAEYYGFTLEPAATVTIEMTSRDVDSWLALRSGSPPGSAEVLEENDDWGGGRDARIERFLDAGTYTIEATTLSAGETGDYTLTVTVDPPR